MFHLTLCLLCFIILCTVMLVSNSFPKHFIFSFWHSLPIIVHFTIFSVFFQIYGRACHMLDRRMAEASEHLPYGQLLIVPLPACLRYFLENICTYPCIYILHCFHTNIVNCVRNVVTGYVILSCVLFPNYVLLFSVNLTSFLRTTIPQTTRTLFC